MVFVKVRGYAEWPAIVLVVEEKYALVKFFNAKPSQRYGEPKYADIYNLVESLQFLHHYKRNKGFTKAVNELIVILQEAVNTQTLPAYCVDVVNKYLELNE